MALTQKVESFTKETSFHGIKYVFDGDARYVRRIVWVIIVVAAVILFTYQVAKRTVVYFDYNTTVSVNVHYTDKVPFPAVTLCNINTFRITEAGRNHWYKCIDEMFSKPDWYKSNSSYCEHRNESIIETEEVVSSLMHQLDDLIYHCRWKGLPCNIKELFAPVWTEVGLCYTFASENEQRVSTETGVGHGLRLTLNIEGDEHMAGPMSGTGAMVLLHDPSEAPLMRDLAYATPPGSHTYLAVKYTKFVNLEAPYDDCHNVAEPIGTCLQRCNIEAAAQKCECTPSVAGSQNITLENNTLPYCDVYGSLCHWKMSEYDILGIKACNCSVPCTRHVFDATLSNSLLDTYKIKQEVITKDKANRLLPKHREAVEISAQVNENTIKNDDANIDQLINKLDNLENVTLSIINYFNNISINNNRRSSIFKNMCNKTIDLYQNVLNTIQDKVCRLDTYSQRLPSLRQFDTLVYNFCGRCTLDECKLGFPSRILSEMMKCISDEERQTQEIDENSDKMIEAGCSAANISVFAPTFALILSDQIPRARCNIISDCTRAIILNDYTQNETQILRTTLSEFRSNYETLTEYILLTSAFDEIPEMTDCLNHIDRYEDLVNSLDILLDLFEKNLTTSNNTTYLKDSIANFLQKIYLFTTVKDVEANCYWFERYAWWRHNSPIHCDNVTRWQYRLSVDSDEINKLEALNKSLTAVFVDYCPFEIKIFESEMEYVFPDWDYADSCDISTNDYDYDPPSYIYGDISQQEFIPEDEENKFSFLEITDPSNPLYEDIEEMQCFSYPITTRTAPNIKVEQMYAEIIKTVEDYRVYSSKKPRDLMKSLKHYKRHEVYFKKSEIAEIMLSPKFEKIPLDMEYYKKRMEQSFNSAKLYFSAGKLYGDIIKLIDITTEFTYGGISLGDIIDDDLIALGRELAVENEIIERCIDDTTLCRLSTEGESILTEPFEHICYLTGDLLLQIKNNFTDALNQFAQTYSKFVDELKIYKENIDGLSDQFYKQNFLNLDIYYKVLSIEEVTQQPAFEFLSLLGEVGGFLGLLLGASVITVCEVIDFIFVTAATGLHRQTETINRN